MRCTRPMRNCSWQTNSAGSSAMATIFASWCVRLGLPIADPGIWTTITTDPEAAEWPNWKPKIMHAMRRLILASDLRKTGDLTAASEEVLYAAAHTARGDPSASSGVFPSLDRRWSISSQRLATSHSRSCFVGCWPKKRAIGFCIELCAT